MAEQQFKELPPSGLRSEQKVGFFLLLVFSVITIALGVLQIRNTMFAPFALNNVVPVGLKEEVNTIDALRYRDTDKDGLSDFDELYVYNTSPYLYDTFSYGMSDKQVVAKGLPLCPGGKCVAEADLAGNTSSTKVIATDAASSVALSDAQTATQSASDLAKVLTDPKQLRQLLVTNNGMDPKILEKISDAELMKMVSQTMSSSSTLDSLQSLNGLISISSTSR